LWFSINKLSTHVSSFYDSFFVNQARASDFALFGCAFV
jgi:hypothetical protein